MLVLGRRFTDTIHLVNRKQETSSSICQADFRPFSAAGPADRFLIYVRRNSRGKSDYFSIQGEEDVL